MKSLFEGASKITDALGEFSNFHDSNILYLEYISKTSEKDKRLGEYLRK